MIPSFQSLWSVKLKSPIIAKLVTARTAIQIGLKLKKSYTKGLYMSKNLVVSFFWLYYKEDSIDMLKIDHSSDSQSVARGKAWRTLEAREVQRSIRLQLLCHLRHGQMARWAGQKMAGSGHQYPSIDEVSIIDLVGYYGILMIFDDIWWSWTSTVNFTEIFRSLVRRPSPINSDSPPPPRCAAGVPRDVRSASFPMRTFAGGPCPAVAPSGNLASMVGPWEKMGKKHGKQRKGWWK